MDAQGIPSGFFIVNRWVTKGAWLTKAQCEHGLQHFKIQASKGKKEINIFYIRWYSYTATIFRHCSNNATSSWQNCPNSVIAARYLLIKR